MRCSFSTISFGDSFKTYKNGKSKIVEHYNIYDILTRRIEYDEFNRDIDSKSFNSSGKVIEHLHKEYFETETEKGHIETFKSSTQEYLRKSYTKFVNGFRHSIDEYISKTKPENSYINEFIYDLKGKLIDVCSKKL